MGVGSSAGGLRGGFSVVFERWLGVVCRWVGFIVNVVCGFRVNTGALGGYFAGGLGG